MIPIILLLLFISPAWSLAQETEELSLVEAPAGSVSAEPVSRRKLRSSPTET